MTIAINLTNFIKAGGSTIFQDYFLNLAGAQPQHQFIFITSSPIDDRLNILNKIEFIVSAPRSNNPLMWRIWLNYTLPGIAKRFKADLLINTGGVGSLRTIIPQYSFLSTLDFLKSPHYYAKKEVLFLKKYLPAFLKKATVIVSASDFITGVITQQYSICIEKIKRVQLMAGNYYQPLDWKEKESIKASYTTGKEYFLFSGEIMPGINLVNLLKAFSFFKKRQKSNMQLIITAAAVLEKDPFIENFKTYKYRKEVCLLLDLPEKDLAKITASAYAFIYPSMYEGSAMFPLQAMQCEVPVITTKTTTIYEVIEDAALYADPENFEDIAEKMMLLFKDETTRSAIINRGKLRVERMHADQIENHWWPSISE